MYECNACGMVYDTVKELQDHVTTHPKEDEQKEVHEGVNVEGTLNNAMKVVTFEVEGVQKVDVLQFFSDR